MSAARLIFGLVICGLLAGCARTSQHESTISGHYGSIAYEGTILRDRESGKYVYVVQDLTLTFRPNANVNRISSIESPELGLLTSDDRTRTSETWAPLNVTLDKSHPSARVRNVKFVVDKQKVDDSMSTTFAVTNDHLLWPLPSQLKPDGKSLQSPMGDY
jgi:hypothetical protein